MNNLFYPAIFEGEDLGFSVSVPDLDGCFSQGDTLADALSNIKEAIGLYLDNTTPPTPSDAAKIAKKLGDNAFVMMVQFDKQEYVRRNNNRSVKKTLTIPAWLNDLAEANHINFSSVLQTSLKDQLHIDR